MKSKTSLMIIPLPLYLSFFLAANFGLSYASWGLETKLWVGLFGLALPFLVVLLTTPLSSKPPFLVESFPSPPIWVWVGFGFLAIVVRFYHLTTLTVWPHYDEATTGYYGMSLSQKWDSRMFYEGSQSPPAYLWGLGLFFKCFGVSLGTLWFFPALLSALTLPFTYGAARQFFSKSFSFLVTFGMAFGFWALFMGRFSLMAILVLFWECVVLFLLGKCVNARGLPQQGKWTWILGGATGLGFYTGLHWIAFAPLVLLTLVVLWVPKSLKNLGRFLVPCGLFLLPLIWAAIGGNSGLSFKHLWAFHQPIPPSEQARISLSYISSLFWGLDPKAYTFQPVFGGEMNPIMSSIFFVGLLVMGGNLKNPLNRWLGFALLFSFLPGLLTKECEPLRILTVLPILLVISAVGFQRLLEEKSIPYRTILLVLFLSISFSLDFYHLSIRYHNLWDSTDNWKGYSKSIDRYRAYGHLVKRANEDGPGLVFSNFMSGFYDQSLSIATYSFNTVENPNLAFENARWVALLTNVNYRPFLEGRFGPGEAFALSSDLNPSDGGWMLWIVAIKPDNREIFRGWWQADRSLNPAIDRYLSLTGGQSYSEILSDLNQAQFSFEKDPFLISCLGEKISDLYLKESFLLARTAPEDRSGKQMLDLAIQSLRQALSRGYPSAHLYNHLGFLELLSHNEPEAKKAFQMALKAPLNLTNSAQYLQ